MSKYVDHPHGLNIGSGVFFVIDKDIDEGAREGMPPLVLPDDLKDIRDDYLAHVAFYSYSFKQISTLNVMLDTPAQQLVWRKQMLKWETPYTCDDGRIIMLPNTKIYYTISEWWENWLNKNVGPKYEKWDVYSRSKSRHIFFKRRKDALAFVRYVGLILEGIKIGDF